MSRSSRRSLFFILLVILVCGFLGVGFSQRNSSAPTADDASLDQQLLDKSLSAQRILAERKAPASQTGKVSVDEPVGSSPAAMDTN